MQRPPLLWSYDLHTFLEVCTWSYLMICRARIDHRIKQLTEGLMSELQVSPERSLRGGPRAARRAVAQLIRLGKSAQVRLYIDTR